MSADVCPRCGSPARGLHPATEDGLVFAPCQHEWHAEPPAAATRSLDVTSVGDVSLGTFDVVGRYCREFDRLSQAQTAIEQATKAAEDARHALHKAETALCSSVPPGQAFYDAKARRVVVVFARSVSIWANVPVVHQ